MPIPISRIGLASFALAHGLLASCSTDAPTLTKTQALDSNLRLDVLTNSEVYGSYESTDGVVEFKAFVSDVRIDAVAYVNGVEIDIYATSEDEGHVGFRVHGGELDRFAHALLEGIHVELASRFPYPEEGAPFDETPAHVQLLRSYLGLLSEAPERIRDDIYDTHIREIRELDREPKYDPPPKENPPPPPPPCGDVADDDGVRPLSACCRGGTVVPFQHDDIPGGHCFMTISAWCGYNSPIFGGALATDCPGRCGPTCLAFPGYYQDCLDHDLCLVHDNGGSGLTPAGKCGDEWNEAVNDFAIAYSWWAPMFWWMSTGQGGLCS